MSNTKSSPEVVIIGAGPAGLTAAFELSKHGITGTIIEADKVVGGIARTEERNGYRFDIGGHRFFTKAREVKQIWDEVMVEPLLVRPRLSRIYYDNKFYDYPLKASNVLKNMGVWTAASCMMSYAQVRMHPIPDAQSFENWVINQFGSKLYSMFFKTYTEKIWGIPCNDIGADWAAQRIRGLNLGEAVRNMIFGQRKGEVVKTLIDEFRYPRLGPGQLWEACADSLVSKGWTLKKNTRVTHVFTESGHITGIKAREAGGSEIEICCNELISSMPVRELVQSMSSAPDDIASAAKTLSYRDFLTVALVVDIESHFPDNWIYIHSPEVMLGRVQNFKNWSREMVPDQSKTCLGLEYFCNDTDDLWNSADQSLVELGYSELEKIGLSGGALVDGYVVRMPKAYPVYNTGYQDRLGLIRDWLISVDGLYCIGRNGQHRYNNMDHSMMTALIAARNIALGDTKDPWAVNEDAEYHEDVKHEVAG